MTAMYKIIKLGEKIVSISLSDNLNELSAISKMQFPRSVITSPN